MTKKEEVVIEGSGLRRNDKAFGGSIRRFQPPLESE